MLDSWLFLWMLFMFIFLLTPVTYGWGYRRWGTPYPRYIQRRRMERAASKGGSELSSHLSWGWIGDMVWIVFFISVFWVVMAYLWR